MALLIRSVPVLKGKAALDFVKKAKENESKKGSVDFSAEMIWASKILAKSKL